jgi:hypothetical protein
MLTAAACKLVRLPKLSAAAWPGCIALLADAEYHISGNENGVAGHFFPQSARSV